MKTKIYWAVLSSAIVLAMTACGTISPPLQSTSETTTTIATAESLPDSAASSEAESSLEDEKIKTDTFIAEFFDSDISFVDTSELVTSSARATLPKQKRNSRTRTKRLPDSTSGSRSFRRKRRGCRSGISWK